MAFARKKWRVRLDHNENNRALCETAVLFELRAGLRSGDIGVDESVRYQELEKALLPASVVASSRDIAIPFDVDRWLVEKRAALASRFANVEEALRFGRVANADLVSGKLQLNRLTKAVSDEAEALVSSLYRQMPPIKITDILR